MRVLFFIKILMYIFTLFIFFGYGLIVGKDKIFPYSFIRYVKLAVNPHTNNNTNENDFGFESIPPNSLSSIETLLKKREILRGHLIPDEKLSFQEYPHEYGYTISTKYYGINFNGVVS